MTRTLPTISAGRIHHLGMLARAHRDAAVDKRAFQVRRRNRLGLVGGLLPALRNRNHALPPQALNHRPPKAATPVSKPAAAAKPAVKPAPKEPVKAAAPKPKTSHTSLRQSSAASAATKPKTVATESKKVAPPKAKDTTATSPPAVKKPKARSPTRPVTLNSRLTAPTAASAAKLHGEEAKVARKPSTATRPVAKPATAKPSRPSVAPSASTNKRPESRTSTVGAKPSFLERMARPTAASASKVHEKPTSPPRKAPAKSSILQKGKKKVEEVATKAKEAVTTNGHADESAKAEPADGTGAPTDSPEEPAAATTTTESAPETTAEKVNVTEAEPVKAETPIPEGESSAMELQTPNFQGEASLIRAQSLATSSLRTGARTASRRCALSTAAASRTPFTSGVKTDAWINNQQRRWQSVAAQVLAQAKDDPSTLTQEDIVANLDPVEYERLSRVRNIGIAAHIDSGKTTVTERVLYYTGRINAIHEVRGKDAVGAKMDSMDLEREKGITIQSAATFCDWVKKDADGKDEKYHVNLIDTPGHIDFTIEVERALRVLDGAVMILCAVSGVQSQTITVDRQMKRYNIPRLSFVNKMDRMGANPWKAVDQINQKLRIAAAAIQVPIGREDHFLGVVDLVKMQALYSEGAKGETIRVTDEIPADIIDLCKEKRATLIETLADVDDEIAEIFLMEETPTEAQIKAAIRRATISLKFTPVLMGSALADKSVQPMLDAVCDYLPNPSEVENMALDKKRAEAPVKLVSYNSLPFVGLAFKLEESNFGQLTYIRVYQGTLRKGMNVFNARSDKKVKIPKIVRMHSNDMEEVQEIGAGEICAVFGVDCASGDTFTDGGLGYTMTSMFVPEPVISLSIKPKHTKDTPNFSKAMNRFTREDPTFRIHVDPESQETVISGMGELHLDIYVERLRREYRVDCETGQPQVAYRETLTKRVNFDHTLKKQSGGSGDFARIIGWMEPSEELAENKFETQVTGDNLSEKAPCSATAYWAPPWSSTTARPTPSTRAKWPSRTQPPKPSARPSPPPPPRSSSP
ncbi:hypothetical protein OPT61_g7942 [Boeremia exigua]|uniref:Uncharacterized protein n=1 Tax=Boeremia exigua TaxID=749465 RepID=A0ACC2I0X2_9PLEO|nr:hypothetical protein OPT61_g7942 [Boeremia exigua]